MRWLHSATAEASSLGLGHFNFVTVQRSDTMGSQAALTEFTELHRAGCNSSFASFRSELLESLFHRASVGHTVYLHETLPCPIVFTVFPVQSMKNEQHVRRLVFPQMLKLLGLKSQSGLFQMWLKKKNHFKEYFCLPPHQTVGVKITCRTGRRIHVNRL